MPSMLHEGPLDLVREHPEIAVEIVRGNLGVKLPEQLAVSLAPTDMSAVVPVQYLADMVVLVSDGSTGDPVLAVIIEPQLRDNETKRFSWPVYVTTARRISGCPSAVLVVLCPDPLEAEKCRQAIRTGHPGFDLAPIVIDSGNPPVADGGSPYLTVFAASMGGIDMTTESGARRVLDAMASPAVTEADRLRMQAIILNLAPDAARQILEAMMITNEYKKTFIDHLRDEAIAEGLAEGKAEGIAEGKAEGIAEGKAEGIAEGEARGKAGALLSLLDSRGVAVSAEQRQLIVSCTDPAQADAWFNRALTVGTAAEVFAD